VRREGAGPQVIDLSVQLRPIGTYRPHQIGSAKVCELPRAASCSKTEILERSEAGFCTPKNQQVVERDALCAKVCAQRKNATSAHKKVFLSKQYSQVSIIPRAQSLGAKFCTRVLGSLASTF